jgi:hypothetical protein
MSALAWATDGMESGAPVFSGYKVERQASFFSSRTVRTVGLFNLLENAEWDMQLLAATWQDLTVFHSMSRGGRTERYRRAAELLTAWLSEDDGGYDERTWPQVVAELEANPVRLRE